MIRARLLCLALAAAAAGAPRPAAANPWTRDMGRFFASLNVYHLAANRYYGPQLGAPSIELASTFSQTALSLYGEVGVISRWLTFSVDATLLRRSALAEQGATQGMGDLRLGLWSGLLTSPLRLTVGLLLGAPTGDDAPSAGDNADDKAKLIARTLPTGDGEADLEPVLSLGYGFGGPGTRWPLRHYALAEFGYWLRTAGFADAFDYRIELGFNLPYPIIERLWVSFRINGVESFASQEEAAANFNGLGSGVTYTAWGLGAYVRIWRGLGAGFKFDGAFRARGLPAAPHFHFSLAYEH